MTLHSPAPADAPGSQALSHVLTGIANDSTSDRISFADLLPALRHRALATLMLIFALPNALAVPGASVILGLPLIFLAGQLTFGMRPWLPSVMAERSMARKDFAGLISRAAPWLMRAERLLRPRWCKLACPPSEYAIGIVCLLLATILLLPIPLGNALPALAICMFALGLLERDGVWIVAGLITALASVALIWGVLYALLESAIFLLGNWVAR